VCSLIAVPVSHPVFSRESWGEIMVFIRYIDGVKIKKIKKLKFFKYFLKCKIKQDLRAFNKYP
jgi:hypothetical protein